MGLPRLSAPAPALIETYADLIAGARERRLQLGLSQLDVDLKAGWAEGYVSKVEISTQQNPPRNARNIGPQNFPILLGALNLRLVLVDDGKLGIPTSGEAALLLSRSLPPEAVMTLRAHENHTIEHDDERRTLADMLDEEADAEQEDASGLDWNATLDGIRRLSDRDRDSEARIHAAEERARRAEERAAHAELGLRRLHQAVIEASK